MRNKRVDDVRKRIAKRKAEQQRRAGTGAVAEEWFPVLPEQPDASYEAVQEFEADLSEAADHGKRPVFRKELFFFKTLCAACLTLGAGIVFKNDNPALDQARTVISQVMNEEFQFATVSNWYEDQFGKPLTLLPAKTDQQTETAQVDYAVPASGKVLQGFSVNGKGVFVQTNINAPVGAIREGVAIFIGQKEDLGNTIIIQHADGSESWYGNLSEVSVKLYDYVKQKQKIAVVANNEDGKAGRFYFALKKGEKFVDPIPVISFE